VWISKSGGRGISAGTGFPPCATHHCGLPAVVKMGAAGSAAANHVGVSVATIIRASSCRATERFEGERQAGIEGIQ